MILLLVICLMSHDAMSQYQAAPSSQQQSVASKIFYPAAPLHYVNIGPQLTGDYKFGYDTGKGPLGQSFREEMRLADGTVKGSYAIIDESGHKRVVHYASGKGGFIAKEDTKLSNSAFSNIQPQQPKFIMQQNFKSFPQQLPVFKPENYLQARTSQPLYVAPVPVQAVQTDVPENKITAVDKVDKSVTPFYRLSTPLQPANIAVPVYKSPAPIKTGQVVIPLTRGQMAGISQEQHNIAGSSGEVYKPIKRVTKKPVIHNKQQTVQKMTKHTEEQSYDPKIEDEYYDISPAFIDIERLSYNIGTDRSSASL